MNRKRRKLTKEVKMRNWHRNLEVFSIHFLLLTFYFSPVFAQGPDTLWTRTYGGTNDDQAYSVQQTFDGGYIIAGYTKSFGAGNADVYLVKTDSIGDTLWTRTYGDTLFDAAYSVQQTSDSGFIVAGRKEIPDSIWSNIYGYLIKTDKNGDSLWAKLYGWEPYEDARFYSVDKTADGGYIATGFISKIFLRQIDVLLVKTNMDGNVLWHKEYSEGYGYSVKQTSDGGYIIAGTYLIKADSLGDTLWTKPYGGYSVKQTSDGGYVIAGEKGVNGVDVHLIKTDSLGDTLWTRNYGGIHHDEGYSVKQTIDEGYIIAGNTGWYFDISLADTFYDADVYLIKTDSFGDTLWTKIYGDTNNDYGRSVEQTLDSGFIVAGYTKSFGAGDYDVYLIKTGADVGVEEKRKPNVTYNPKFRIYPNPFSKSSTISYQLPMKGNVTLRVYDLSGRLVRLLLSGEQDSGYYVVAWDGSDGNGIKVPRGIYLIRLQAGGHTSMHKVVLLR